MIRMKDLQITPGKKVYEINNFDFRQNKKSRIVFNDNNLICYFSSPSEKKPKIYKKYIGDIFGGIFKNREDMVEIFNNRNFYITDSPELLTVSMFLQNDKKINVILPLVKKQ